MPRAWSRPSVWSQVPILSVRESEAEKIAALNAGAVDYVTKPFASGELQARLRAPVRSRAPAETKAPAVMKGPLVVDLARHLVTLDGVG